jgi:hypothetical protein
LRTDPKPIDPNTLVAGGDWSTHYYNGLIYESDITRGFLIWAFIDPSILGARHLDRLNPQTQEYTTGGRGW